MTNRNVIFLGERNCEFRSGLKVVMKLHLTKVLNDCAGIYVPKKREGKTSLNKKLVCLKRL
ncbi:hypothetical protein BH11BAC5_BH11BAC5_27250 [soil metagenome]